MADFVTLDERQTLLEPGLDYPYVGIRAYGGGLFKGGAVRFGETSYRALNRLSAGMLVLSQVKGWEGAVAICPSEFDGFLASPEYRTFSCRAGRALPEFIGWLARAPWFHARLARLTRGQGARRERVRPELFLELPICLPPLEEQRRLAAQIDRISALVEEARCLLQEAADESLRICWALLHGHGRAAPSVVQLGELVRQRPTDVIVSPDEDYQFAGVYSFGRGVFPGEKKNGAEFAYKELTRLRKGNFTFPKLMAWEGALGVVPPECDGLVVSPEFPVFEIDQDRVLPDVLDVYFRHPTIWPLLKGDSPGTNVRRRRLNPSTFLSLKIPLPSMADQLRLAEVRAQLSEVARARAGSLHELDALVGCLLRHVFGDVGDAPAATDKRTAA